MASTPPSTTAAFATPPPVDPAALRFCPRCRHWMSSLKHDKHTICFRCREVNCNLTDHCDECRDWSSKTMTTYLAYQRSFASKRNKTPQPASVSQPAATGSSVGPSSVSSPAVDDSDRLKEAVMSAIQSLFQTGRLGTNPLPSTAPFPVPDSESHWVSSGDEGFHRPAMREGQPEPLLWVLVSYHRQERIVRPLQCHFVLSNVSLSHRSDQGMSLSLESHDSARLGSQSSQSLSLGSDQLRVSENGSLGASSALSPTSPLFPVLDSGFSSLSAPPISSSSLAPSSLSSVASASSSSLSSSSQFSLPAASIPLPSFTPSSLSSASFPSSSLLSSSLPPSIPSALSSSSSSSSYAPVSAPVSSSSSFSSLSPPPPSSSSLRISTLLELLNLG